MKTISDLKINETFKTQGILCEFLECEIYNEDEHCSCTSPECEQFCSKISRTEWFDESYNYVKRLS